VFFSLSLSLSLSLSVCVCVRERERERDKKWAKVCSEYLKGQGLFGRNRQ